MDKGLRTLTCLREPESGPLWRRHSQTTKQRIQTPMRPPWSADAQTNRAMHGSSPDGEVVLSHELVATEGVPVLDRVQSDLAAVRAKSRW